MSYELSEDEIERHNRLYQEACRLMQGELQLDVAHLSKPGWFTRRKLQKAINYFEQVLEINPANWPAMWGLGKIHQRLGDNAIALEWFTKASLLEPSNADIPREAALCALNLGKNAEAADFAAFAVRLRPEDAGLHANLALALLLAGKPNEAKTEAEHAVKEVPNDKVSVTILKLVDEVIAGKAPYPKHISDLG